MKKEYIRITRTNEPYFFNGVFAPSLSELKKEFMLSDFNNGCIFSDILQGAHKGFLIAKDFARQLGVKEKAEFLLHSEAVDSSLNKADFIGKLVDAESGGDVVTYAAHKLAKLILNVLLDILPYNFFVFIPQSPTEWSRDNIKFLEFFSTGLQQTPHQLWLVATDDLLNNKPPDWNIKFKNKRKTIAPGKHSSIASLLPGIIPSEVLDRLNYLNIPAGEGIKLTDGSFLIDIKERLFTNNVSANLYNSLEEVTKPFNWLEAWRQLHTPDDKADYDFLINEAQVRFAECGYDVAFQLYKRAMEITHNPIQKAGALARLQGLRISLMRFDEVANAPEPDQTSPPKLLGMLNQFKAWGLVMLNRPEDAEPYFSKARELMKGQVNEREYMYLLNISALNKLRLGHVNEALEFEKIIETKLSSMPKDNHDYHLQYINSLNMSRLYKRIGNNNESLRLYERGFDTCIGVRSESDLLYRNVCNAQILERTDRHLETFQYWYRAALHWLAFDVPEGIAPRVAGGIIGKPMIKAFVDPDNISKHLFQNLFNIIQKIPQYKSIADEMGKNHIPVNVPTFCYTENLPIGLLNRNNVFGVGNSTGSVFLLQSELIPGYKSPAFDSLAKMVCAIIKAENNGYEFQTVIVDAQMGTEIPITKSEMINTCIRIGCEQVCFNGEKINPSAFIKNLRVNIGKAVKSIKQLNEGDIEISFKRYLHTKRVDRETGKIILGIEKETSLKILTDSYPSIDVYNSFRMYEQDRIVAFLLDL